MESTAIRYSTVFVFAQSGPHGGKPLFGGINLKPTWAEYEAKVHHTIAQTVFAEQGCTGPMVCCDLEDLPESFGRWLATEMHASKLSIFEAEQRHYDAVRS